MRRDERYLGNITSAYIKIKSQPTDLKLYRLNLGNFSKIHVLSGRKIQS